MTWPCLNFQVSMFALFSLNTDKDFQLSPWRSINYHSATELWDKLYVVTMVLISFNSFPCSARGRNAIDISTSVSIYIIVLFKMSSDNSNYGMLRPWNNIQTMIVSPNWVYGQNFENIYYFLRINMGRTLRLLIWHMCIVALDMFGAKNAWLWTHCRSKYISIFFHDKNTSSF